MLVRRAHIDRKCKKLLDDAHCTLEKPQTHSEEIRTSCVRWLKMNFFSTIQTELGRSSSRQKKTVQDENK